MTRDAGSVAWRPLGDATEHYWLVQRMAKTCGVDPAAAAERGDLSAERWADMVNRCRSCDWVGGCQRWLDRQDSDSDATPPTTCVNAERLRALAERQTG